LASAEKVIVIIRTAQTPIAMVKNWFLIGSSCLFVRGGFIRGGGHSLCREVKKKFPTGGSLSRLMERSNWYISDYAVVFFLTKSSVIV
jgi:hypothetical protein